jgi:hypothetical protein
MARDYWVAMGTVPCWPPMHEGTTRQIHVDTRVLMKAISNSKATLPVELSKAARADYCALGMIAWNSPEAWSMHIMYNNPS